VTTIKAIAAACALAATLAAPAANASNQTRTSVKVTYADLNLASQEGRAVLDRRIKHAVEQTCGRTTGHVGMDKAVRDCQRKAMAAANRSRELAVANYDANRLAQASTKVFGVGAQ